MQFKSSILVLLSSTFIITLVQLLYTLKFGATERGSLGTLEREHLFSEPPRASLVAVKIADACTAHIGDDYPQKWDIPGLVNVYMSVENTRHYSLSNDTEWERLLPSNGVLRLGDDGREFTISMFHQLRCLNILRRTLVSHRDRSIGKREMQLARHCMNYLRQMVLCRSQLHLESVRSHDGAHLAVSETTHTCQDWTAVYDGAEANAREYERSKLKSSL